MGDASACFENAAIDKKVRRPQDVLHTPTEAQIAPLVSAFVVREVTSASDYYAEPLMFLRCSNRASRIARPNLNWDPVDQTVLANDQ